MSQQGYHPKVRYAVARLIQFGHRVHGPHLILKTTGETGDRGVVVVVSKAVASHATMRNRIRRRIRATFTPIIRKLPPSRVVIIVRSSEVARVPFAELSKEVLYLLHRARLLV